VKTGGAGGALSGSVNLGGKSPQSDIWVVKWVDYSLKYGLGYLLLNDATGVFFNDNTKIILSPCGTYFDYIERQVVTGQNQPSDLEGGRQDVLNSYKMENYPKEITKKVALLEQFKKYLIEKRLKEDGTNDRKRLHLPPTALG
jgi:hypothetical protein